MKKDVEYIKMAIELAKKGRYPYGAVVVKNDEIIGYASSGDGDLFDPTNHAETQAIRMACKKIGSNDLSGATIYSSCEPCLMCFGTIWWSNIRKIVYAASIEHNVANDVCPYLKGLNISVNKLNELSSNDFEIIGGILEDKANEIMKNWKKS